MERLRLVYTVDCLKKGGSENQLITLLQNVLNTSEYDIYLILRNSIVEYTLPADKKLHLMIPEHNMSKIEYYSAFKRIVEEYKPSIVQTWEKTTSTAAAIMKSALPEAFSLIDCTSRFGRQIPKSQIAYWQFRFNHVFSDIVVGNSLAALKVFNHEPGGKYRLIRNAISVDRFNVAKNFKKNMESKHAITMIANFTKPKDHGTLVLAAISLLKKGYNIEINFVGDGPLLQSVKNTIPIEFNQKFIFHGSLKEVFSLLSKSHIGVLLSQNGHAEGMSNAIMEYMSSGLPVVCTDAGGNPEIVQHGINGILIPYRCSDSLENALIKIITTPGMRTTMGRESRSRAERDFSESTMLNSYTQLYRSLAR